MNKGDKKSILNYISECWPEAREAELLTESDLKIIKNTHSFQIWQAKKAMLNLFTATIQSLRIDKLLTWLSSK